MAAGSTAAADYKPMIRPLLAAAAIIASTGCAGSPLAPAPLTELAGTNWRVAAVNGRPTPGTGDYTLRFDRNGGVGGRFGCNSMGGQYQLIGDLLTVSDLASTLIGCPDRHRLRARGLRCWPADADRLYTRPDVLRTPRLDRAQPAPYPSFAAAATRRVIHLGAEATSQGRGLASTRRVSSPWLCRPQDSNRRACVTLGFQASDILL